jgi:hypothetical protein
VSRPIAIGRVERAAPPEETTDDLHAETALVDRKIDDLRTFRRELVREITHRQLQAATNGTRVAKASKR